MANLWTTLRRVGRPLLACVVAAVLSTGAMAVTIEGSKARLQWSPSTASGTTLAGYTASVSYDGGSTWEVFGETAAGVTQISLSGSFGEDALVRVRAFGADGTVSAWSPTSEVIQFREPGTTVPEPDAPVISPPGPITVTIDCSAATPTRVVVNLDGKTIEGCE